VSEGLADSGQPIFLIIIMQTAFRGRDTAFATPTGAAVMG
jgi:hypothetical protein